MSGGWAVKAKKRGWCGPERSDYTARVFCPKGCLDGLGAAGPELTKWIQPKAVTDQNNGRMGGSEAETIRQHRDRLKGQPQEREHSDAEGGTRDRLPPARGTLSLARGIVTRRAETRHPACGICGAR